MSARDDRLAALTAPPHKPVPWRVEDRMGFPLGEVTAQTWSVAREMAVAKYGDGATVPPLSEQDAT